MTPKEWAKQNGWPNISLGRGRMPKDASLAYQAWLKGQPQPTAPDKPAKAPTKKGEFVEPAPRVNPETATVYAVIDGRKVYGSMRAACFYCHVSLGWCKCPAPKAIVSNTSGYVPVVIEV